MIEKKEIIYNMVSLADTWICRSKKKDGDTFYVFAVDTNNKQLYCSNKLSNSNEVGNEMYKASLIDGVTKVEVFSEDTILGEMDVN